MSKEQETNQILHALIQACPLAIILLDPEGKVKILRRISIMIIYLFSIIFILRTGIYAQDSNLFFETFEKSPNQTFWNKNLVWDREMEPVKILENSSFPIICDNFGSGSAEWEVRTGRDTIWHMDGYLTVISKAAVQGGKLYSKQYLNDNGQGRYWHGTNTASTKQQFRIVQFLNGALNHQSRLAIDFNLIGAYGTTSQVAGFISFNVYLLYGPGLNSQSLVGGWYINGNDAYPLLRTPAFNENYNINIKDVIRPQMTNEEFDTSVGSSTARVGIVIETRGVLSFRWDMFIEKREAYLEFTVDNIKIYRPSSIDPTKQSSQDKVTTVAEPINVANGNMFTSITDISIPAAGLPLEISRTYNSQDDFIGSFGYGWRTNFDITLTEEPDQSVIEVDEKGVYAIYTKNPDGSYKPSAGKYSQLTKNVDGTYTILRKHGKKLLFNSEGLLTRIEDRNANTLDILRDTEGLIQEAVSSSGRNLLFTSDSEGKITEVKDPADRSFKYEYDSQGNLIRAIGPLNHSTRYEYDADHNLICQIDARGNSLYFEYDSDDRANHSWQDNQNNEVTLVFDPANKTTTSTDSLGKTTKYEYNTYGLVTKITDAQSHTQSFIWDDNLNKTSSTDKNGNTTISAYDTKGNLLTLRDPLNNTTAFTYEPNFDLLSSITDALGNKTEYLYDAKGNLIQTKDALGNLTNYTYDFLGQLTQIKDANNNTTNFTYDADGNLVQINDALNNQTKFNYDVIGNFIQLTDAKDNATQFTYDFLSRLTQITYPDNSKVSYAYDAVGSLISFTDPNNNITTYTYDTVSRLTQITDTLDNTTQYTYDTEGNRTAIIDANSNKTQYFYDNLNRLIKTLDSLNNQTLFNYDLNGNLIAKTDANGNTINYTYDALNRLIKKQYPDQTEVIFSYDAKGSLLTAANQNISYSYNYNPLGKLIKVTDSNNRLLTYAYDALSNKTQMASPEGKVTNYTYDALNRLSSILDIYGNTTAYAYDSLGRRINTLLPNGIKATYAYDSLNNLLSLINKTQDDKIISSYAYEYDLASNRLVKTDPELKTVYTYDALYRLTQTLSSKIKDNPKAKEKQKPEELYSYDALGNRFTSLKDTYTYNNLNQLLISQNYNYEYDANGNLIKKTEIDEEDGKAKTTLLSYDFENRLIQVLIKKEDETKFVSFKYDPFGRRIEKRVEEREEDKIESKTTAYIYDNEDIILEYATETEDNQTKEEITRYTHGPGIDERISIEKVKEESPDESAPDIYYYHYDGLGSVTILTDENGKTAEEYEYDSFGNLKRHGNKTKNRFTYTGREYDKETGLYYYRNRYYDPKIGRFITADPLGFIDGPNPYVYVKNNPVNWVDPWGLSTVRVGYKKIIGIGDFAIWHTFIKVTYEGQTKMIGFDAKNRIQIPFTLIGLNIPGVVRSETGGQDFQAVSDDSTQAMIIYNILSDIEDSKQFNWKSYNYGNKNCYDWVTAVLSAAGIKQADILPWRH